MQKPVIIVSGKNGQLGNELRDISQHIPQFNFLFFGRDELDISNLKKLGQVFEQYQPAFFINTAAYTAVDKAETDQENAYLNNAKAPGDIAVLSKTHHTKLIHISTDYVFDGTGTVPYSESDSTNPVNYYGYTKLMGEQLALKNSPDTIILRSSWVYSMYGHNFVKTILRLMKERTDINVVADQFGSPTYAKDLAEAIMKIIADAQQSDLAFKPGIYHFSNSGSISWFEFATAIRDYKQFNCKVHPITTEQYPTSAKRPVFSVLNKEKIQSVFNIALKDWRDSLKACLENL